MTKSIGQNRLLQQMKSMVKERSDNIFCQPLQNDLFIWHFTILGPQNTDFHQGIYHGQIVLPFQYPFKPPDIYFFTKNGRFEVSTKICLTITQYHPEQWNPGWTIRTMLEAVISLFNEHVPGVGFVDLNSAGRKTLALESHKYVCEKCGPVQKILNPRKPLAGQPTISQPNINLFREGQKQIEFDDEYKDFEAKRQFTKQQQEEEDYKLLMESEQLLRKQQKKNKKMDQHKQSQKHLQQKGQFEQLSYRTFPKKSQLKNDSDWESISQSSNESSLQSDNSSIEQGEIEQIKRKIIEANLSQNSAQQIQKLYTQYFYGAMKKNTQKKDKSRMNIADRIKSNYQVYKTVSNSCNSNMPKM